MGPRASFAIYLSDEHFKLFYSLYRIYFSTIISRLFFTVFSTRHQSWLHTHELVFLVTVLVDNGDTCMGFDMAMCAMNNLYTVCTANTNTRIRTAVRARARSLQCVPVTKKEIEIVLFYKLCRPYHLKTASDYFFFLAFARRNYMHAVQRETLLN